MALVSAHPGALALPALALPAAHDSVSRSPSLARFAFFVALLLSRGSASATQDHEPLGRVVQLERELDNDARSGVRGEGVSAAPGQPSPGQPSPEGVSAAPGQPSPIARLPSVRVVTALYRMRPKKHRAACAALGSMLTWGHNVTLLTKVPPGVELNNQAKVAMYREWLRQRAKEEQQRHADGGAGSGEGAPLPQGGELFLLVDGEDVILQQSPEYTARTAASLLNQTHPIIVSSQKGCYPVDLFPTCLQGPYSPYEAAYAAYPTKNRTRQAPFSPNSGCILGGASVLVRLLDGFTKEEMDNATNRSDQALFVARYANGSHGIQLDMASALCHSAEPNLEELRAVSVARPSAVPQFRNNITGSVPTVLHFNGPSKHSELAEELIGSHLLLSRVKGRQGLGQLTDEAGQELSFGELCSEEHLGLPQSTEQPE